MIDPIIITSKGQIGPPMLRIVMGDKTGFHITLPISPVGEVVYVQNLQDNSIKGYLSDGERWIQF